MRTYRGSVAEDGLSSLLLLAEAAALSSRLLPSKVAGKENTGYFCVMKLPLGGHWSASRHLGRETVWGEEGKRDLLPLVTSWS